METQSVSNNSLLNTSKSEQNFPLGDCNTRTHKFTRLGGK